MDKAYLIATIDSTVDPPQITGVSLIGEPWETATLSHSAKRCYANLCSATGRDWEVAVANLRSKVEHYAGLRWTLAWLDAGRPDHPAP